MGDINMSGSGLAKILGQGLGNILFDGCGMAGIVGEKVSKGIGPLLGAAVSVSALGPCIVASAGVNLYLVCYTGLTRKKDKQNIEYKGD
tara:strand:+ start:261 stop:527 length:267 start_codon:yes stop_codon:yes gene_type:complete